MGLPRRIGLSAALAGMDPRATVGAFRGAPRYVADFVRFNRMARRGDAPKARLSQAIAAMADAGDSAGAGHSEYFLTDLHVARAIHARHPQHHVDVGSRIDGFVGNLLTFMDVDVIDIRPMDSTIAGLRFVVADAANDEGFAEGNAESVSTLHALEHFGLGRYGDPIDPEGHRKGLRSVANLVCPGGWLYIAVPVGVPTINFNAHRVLSPMWVVEELGSQFDLVKFAAVRDGRVDEDCEPSMLTETNYAVGIYELQRRPSVNS